MMYTCIVADPPWRFGDKLPGASRGAEKNYKVMSLEDIEAFLDDENVEVADDALLFMWRVSAMVEEAYCVVRAWGFTPKSEIVWEKTSADGSKLHFGMGRYVRGAHESCIIASRGKGGRLIRNHSTRSVFPAPVGAHSEKPDEFYRIVEALCPGPRLDIFARKRRPNWDAIGDELPEVSDGAA